MKSRPISEQPSEQLQPEQLHNALFLFDYFKPPIQSIMGATERRAARDRFCFGTFFWRSGDMQIWSAY